VKLEDYVELLSGYAFSSKKFNEEGNGMPIIRIRDVGQEESGTYFDGDYDSKYLINKGDLLIAMDGEFRLARWSGRPSLLNQRVCKIRSNSDELLDDYLYYILPEKLKKIEDATSYVTVKHLSMKKINAIEIPLPTLSEQKAIVAKLDRAQRLIEIDKEMLAKYDDLIQSVFLEMFGDPVTNPKGWERLTIGEVCDVKGGKRVPKGKNLLKVKTNHPYIKAQNIKNGVVTQHDLEYLSENLADKLSRYTVEKGDVCITVVGANIGDIGVVPEELSGANLTENANKLLIKNKDKLTNMYLAYYMMTDYVKKQIYQKTMAVGVPKLAIFRIKDIQIVLPTIKEQNKFALHLKKIETLRNKTRMGLKKSEELFSSLVQEAFG
jgi:type I restriction enzyme S subunit